MTNHIEAEETRRLWAVFELAGDVFAVVLEQVQEVLVYQPLTPVPLSPPHVAGLLNLRGELVPTIDLGHQLYQRSHTPTLTTSFIVLHSDDGPVSIIVDEVNDIVELADAQWQPAPSSMPQQRRQFVNGVQALQERDLLGLNVDAVVRDQALTERQEA